MHTGDPSIHSAARGHAPINRAASSDAQPRIRLPLRVGLLLMAMACAQGSFAATAAVQPGPPARPAAEAAPLPEWDKLSAAQRALLIAPMRQRWNDSPDRRGDMYQHAQRWQSMTPEQRRNARSGKKRFDMMDPAQRAEARVLFERMQALPPDQRRALRERWKAMTPEQRREWVRSNAAP